MRRDAHCFSTMIPRAPAINFPPLDRPHFNDNPRVRRNIFLQRILFVIIWPPQPEFHLFDFTEQRDFFELVLALLFLFRLLFRCSIKTIICELFDQFVNEFSLATIEVFIDIDIFLDTDIDNKILYFSFQLADRLYFS